MPIDFVQPDLLAALLTIDPRIPVPMFISEEDAAAITSAAPAEAPIVYRRIINRLRENKREITTLYLVRESASGVAYQEDFLGFLPEVTFNSPKLDDPTKQEFSTNNGENASRLWVSRATWSMPLKKSPRQ